VGRAPRPTRAGGASADQIEPLLDAVGHDGVYFLSWFGSEAEAEKYLKVADKLRR